MFWKVCLWVWAISTAFYLLWSLAVGFVEAYKYKRYANSMGWVYCGEKRSFAERLIHFVRMVVIACIPIYNTIACLILVFAYDTFCDSLRAEYEKNYCAPDELPPSREI